MYKLLLVAALCLAAIAGHAQPVPVYNLDFEQLDHNGRPAGWGFGTVRDQNGTNSDTTKAYQADSVTKYSGRYSLLIDWTQGYRPWTPVVYRVNQVFKGKHIKLTGYVKTEHVAGTGAWLWMRLDGEANENLGFDNMMNRPVKGTTDWKEYSIDLSYDPDKVKAIYFGGLIVGSGKVWLDNLKLTIDGKDIAIAQPYTATRSSYAADNDTAFTQASGITATPLNDNKIKALNNLGMLWGFLKYYHAGVAAGGYNMDAELCRVLPKVLNAKDLAAANHEMEVWVDDFGRPPVCRSCCDCDLDDTKKMKLLPDFGCLFANDNLPATLTAKLDYIRLNRLNEKRQYYVAPNAGTGNPVFLHERGYAKSSYPDAGIRLLALYRYWNMVQYFFPDKHLIGEDWNKVLAEFVPLFWNAADTLQYQRACLKLISRIHDTHANIWGGGNQLENLKGRLILPVEATFIDNKLVVTDYYSNSPLVQETIKKGDVIERIDNVPVDELVHKYLEVTPASNYETQLRDQPATYGFLLRSNKADATLTIRRGNDKIEVPAQRIELENVKRKNTGDKGYTILPGNIGYLYPANLTDDDIGDIKSLFRHTKGVIIDMRCYPSTFMPFTYGRWLKGRPSRFVKFTAPDMSYPGCFRYEKGARNGGLNLRHFKGKTVIIVNATTQSQAEYTTMALSTVPGATVIGSTTAGADGDVSAIMLPGGIRTMFSGLGILYPDGTETQRKGVKIDKVVKPTLQGIKDGKDELMDEAEKIIKG